MSETTAEPTAIAVSADDDASSGEPDAAKAPSMAPPADGDASLLALVDRLAAILERSDLVELEVEAGGTGLVLRKPEALPGQVAGQAPAATASAASAPVSPPGGTAAGSGRPSVTAPLTGIWYSAPSPGSPPFVQVGGEVAAGQVIGLIEAMKLFNEIKSDRSGRVAAVLAESGQLVKARQPLIEVVPL
jgi:acetyl-CoA carboxylase biotin carboxyl carrier protein